MAKSDDTYRAIADSFRDWLDDNRHLVAAAIEAAVREYISDHGLPKITVEGK